MLSESDCTHGWVGKPQHLLLFFLFHIYWCSICHIQWTLLVCNYFINNLILNNGRAMGCLLWINLSYFAELHFCLYHYNNVLFSSEVKRNISYWYIFNKPAVRLAWTCNSNHINMEWNYPFMYWCNYWYTTPALVRGTAWCRPGHRSSHQTVLTQFSDVNMRY